MAGFVESRFTWARGDWGNMGSFLAGRTEDGWFKATNMVVHEDGSIGPRAGLKARTYTGLPTGQIRSWGYVGTTVGAVDGIIIFVVGNTLYWVPAFEDGACTTVGTLAGTETEFCSAQPVLSNGIVYFATRNQGVYKWDVSGTTVTQVLATTGIYDLVRYGERLYAATTQRVYYSNAADFGTWTVATDFFDVGWQFATYRMASLRNNLFFFRQGGGHYVMSGAPGTTSTLRQTGTGLPPDEHSATVIPAEDAAVWVPQARNAPVYYRGGLVDSDRWAHLEDWTGSTQGFRTGAYSYGDRAIALVGTIDNKMLLRRNEVWTKHELGVDGQLITRLGDDWFAFSDGGGAAATPKFWVWEYGVDSPGIVGTEYPPGDGSNTPVTATLSLPEWWHPQGAEVRVTKVEVDFVSWDTGTTETAHFDLYVDTKRPRAVESVTSGGQTSTAVSFDEAVASSAATGTERHGSWNVGDQGWGRGYQIRLTNLRSVSIRSVTVTAQTEARDAR